MTNATRIGLYWQPQYSRRIRAADIAKDALMWSMAKIISGARAGSSTAVNVPLALWQYQFYLSNDKIEPRVKRDVFQCLVILRDDRRETMLDTGKHHQWRMRYFSKMLKEK